MEDILKELQQEYIQSIPSKMTEIQNFLQAKDIENLINSFHKIKGSGKTYGLEEMSVLGQFFEHWMRDQQEKVLPYVPKAIEFLNKVYTSRQKNTPFPLADDPEFIKLQSLISP
jgi:HPt (histidine-containing phosphotransfer) domain-containing protein